MKWLQRGLSTVSGSGANVLAVKNSKRKAIRVSAQYKFRLRTDHANTIENYITMLQGLRIVLAARVRKLVHACTLVILPQPEIL
jgi:4-diphosphocytidyl-2C-methyl-D-erythritol kinase